MPAFLLMAIASLVFATTSILFAAQIQPSALVGFFLALPTLQQVSWALICLVPFCVIAAALFQHWRLIEKRKAADVLETRLRSIHRDVALLEQEQKESELAAKFIEQSDPAAALRAVQERIAASQQNIQIHQEQHLAANLTDYVEKLRQQQQDIRHKTGDMIAKMRSVQSAISQLQGSQDEMEKGISAIEQERNGETLDRSLQRLAQFISTMNTRCDEIERSIPGLLDLEVKFDALQRRLAPMEAKDTGVKGLLHGLTEMRKQLDHRISGLEQDDGVVISARAQELLKVKDELDQRVSGLLVQYSQIEAIRKEMLTVFARLNQGRGMGRESEADRRVVPTNGNGEERWNGDASEASH